jgi:hypothetical protein
MSARAQVSDMDPRMRTPTSGVYGALRCRTSGIGRNDSFILDGTIYDVNFAQADAIELVVYSIVQFDESVRTTYLTVSQRLPNSHGL